MSDPSLIKVGTSSDAQAAEERVQQSFFRKPTLGFVIVRVCLYLILAQATSYVLVLVVRFFVRSGLSPQDPRGLMIGEAIALAGVFSAGWIMCRLEVRPFGAYGLPWQIAFGKLFWQGVLFGLIEISAVIAIIAALGCYRFGKLALHGPDLFRWAAFWALLFLIVGFYEEFAFRGYPQFTLAQGMGFWPAAGLLSLIFGFVHLSNRGETWVGIAGIVLTALFWCLTLRRTGSLWFAVGMHASFDFGETFLYSVPDSGTIFPGHLSNATLAGPPWVTGGSAGPEASVFDFVMLLAFFYIFHRLYPPESEREANTR
jgi:membrane protease YdiL (CAAX protease family)